MICCLYYVLTGRVRGSPALCCKPALLGMASQPVDHPSNLDDRVLLSNASDVFNPLGFDAASTESGVGNVPPPLSPLRRSTVSSIGLIPQP